MKPNKPTQEHKPLVMVQSIDEKITGVSAECNCGWKIQFAPYSERSWDMAETAKQDHLKKAAPQPTVGEQTDDIGRRCAEENGTWRHATETLEDYSDRLRRMVIAERRLNSPTPIPVGEQAKEEWVVSWYFIREKRSDRHVLVNEREAREIFEEYRTATHIENLQLLRVTTTLISEAFHVKN